jgi:predicted short-subunit dehydrogenase-like oxidoreductase (DUF2520 family)
LFTKKSDIIFIGAGKVANSLIPLLIENNYSVKGIVSRSIKSATSVYKRYKPDYYSDSIPEIPQSFKIFFITVPDNEIKTVAKKLSLQKLDFKKSLFVHTSGSESSDALKVIERKGGITASFHIMQTFPSKKKTDVKNSFAAIETSNEAAGKFLFLLARRLNLKAFKLSKESKVYYHLAGVFAANFLTANFFSSKELLSKTELNHKDFLLLFEPIVNETLSNIKSAGIENSLSGPLQRGDYLTVKKHITSIKKSKLKEKKLLLHSYISQSLILLELIKKQNKILSAGQREVGRLLKAETKNFGI